MDHGDIADRADIAIQRELDAGLAAVRARAATATVTTGKCFYCDDAVGEGMRFCDRDCAREFERQQAARRRNGKA